MKHFIIFLLLITSFSFESFAQQDSEQELTLFRKILYEIVPSPLKRNVRRFFKKQDNQKSIDKVEAFLYQLSMNEQDVQPILQKTPYSYYTFLGLWSKYIKKDSIMAAFNFKIAADFYKENRHIPSNDLALSRKIIKFMRKYRLSNCTEHFDSITSRSVLLDWQEDHERKFLSKEQKEILALEISREKEVKEKNILVKKRDSLNTTKDSLQELVSNKVVKLKNLTLKNYEKALQEVDVFKLRNGNKFKGNITKTLDCGAILQVSEAGSAEPLTEEFYSTGYQLGKHCSDEIIKATDKVVNSIFDLINFKENYNKVPKSYKDSVKIKVKIIGKADGKRISKNEKGISLLKYKDTNVIPPTEYYSDWIKQKKIRQFSLDSPIDDDDLAFLRAYCSANELKKIMNNLKVNNTNLKIEYVAKVFDLEGEEYRGVELNIDVINLFEHYLDNIKAIESEVKELNSQIDKKKKNIDDYDKKIDSKNKSIEKRKKEIYEAKERIKSNQKK